MKLKELKSMLENASNEAEIKIENGEIHIYEPIAFKFNVGDKVTFKGGRETYTITDRFIAGKDCRAYKLDDCENVEEDKIELYVPQDIIERIKTFEDAVEWCRENNKKGIIEFYVFIYYNFTNAGGEIDEEYRDILAYLKLRIITCALNEGWEPIFEKFSYLPIFRKNKYIVAETQAKGFRTTSKHLLFKTPDLANYASNQFRDLYADFCGICDVKDCQC